MESDFYLMRLELTAFLGAHIEEVPNAEGVLERSVVIPIDRNGLRESSWHRVRGYIYVHRLKSYVNENWTHSLKMKLPKDKQEQLRDLGYEIPYVGFMKPWINKYYNGIPKEGYSSKVKDIKYDDND